MTLVGNAPFGAGRFKVSDDGTAAANYYITDHLGSTRVVFDAAKNVLDRINYYPFGRTWTDASTRYQHTGMENQSQFGIKWNDHGARITLSDLAIWQEWPPFAKCRTNDYNCQSRTR